MESTIGQEKHRLWTTAYEICCTASLKTESEVKTLIASFDTWCLLVSHNIHSKFRWVFIDTN
jgi:hypothetical protein